MYMIPRAVVRTTRGIAGEVQLATGIACGEPVPAVATSRNDARRAVAFNYE